MKEIIFTRSISGLDGAFACGKVYTATDEEIKKYVPAAAMLYDDHVSDVKSKARGTLKALKNKPVETATKKKYSK